MPWPKVSGARETAPYSLFPEEPIVADVEVIDIPVIHELGSDLNGGIIQSTRVIGPSKRPVIVKVESQVVASGLQAIQSAEYMATVRRRKARELSVAFEQLEPHTVREDFAVCTYPVLKQVNELLATLLNAGTEGNTREILRQLRNTLMNGGWNRYRAPDSRRTALTILARLAEAEEILPKDVDEVFDRLYDAGLHPVGAPLFTADEEDEAPDGETEIPC